MDKSESTEAGRRKRPAARRAVSAEEGAAAPSPTRSEPKNTAVVVAGAAPATPARPGPARAQPSGPQAARAPKLTQKRATARRVVAAKPGERREGAPRESAVGTVAAEPAVSAVAANTNAAGQKAGVVYGNAQPLRPAAPPGASAADAVSAIRARAEAAARASQPAEVSRSRAPQPQPTAPATLGPHGRAAEPSEAEDPCAPPASAAAARARAAQLTLAAARARAATGGEPRGPIEPSRELKELLAELEREGAEEPAAIAPFGAQSALAPGAAERPSGELAPRTGALLRRWGRFGLRNRSEQVDDFGLDPSYEASLRPFFEKVLSGYFRAEVEGLEHVPRDGRAILVCNHSGALPWDGVMLRTALRMHHTARRELRWLVEDHVFHAPFLGTFVNRIGAVRACQENAERLLRREELVAVFPEGIKGIAKPYSERYKLQRFGRGGYVRLALRTGAPVIPVAIVGAEETYPLLYKLSVFSKTVGLPFIPVTPTFPWLGPLGMAPLPSRWRISFGAPIREIERHDAEAARDEVLVHELNECARAAVRSLLDRALEQRGQNAFM